MISIALTWLALCVISPVASAAERMALIFGIADYKSLEKLDNPVRDAGAMAALLEKHGFNVHPHVNPDHAAFSKALVDFREASRNAREVIVYYAGHGMTVLQDNRLVNALAATDASLSCETRQGQRMVAMREILDAIAHIPNQVVLFDSCRDDPLAGCKSTPLTNTLKGFQPPEIGERRIGASAGGASRSASASGVGSTNRATVLVGYATSLGKTALDGDPNSHSPFTTALLGELAAKPKLPIREVLDHASQKVAALTENFQVPWVVTEGGEPKICLSAPCLSRQALSSTVQASDVAILLKHGQERLDRYDYEAAVVLATEALAHALKLADRTLVSQSQVILNSALNSQKPYQILTGSEAIGHVKDIALTRDGSLATTFSTETVQIMTTLAGRRVPASQYRSTLRVWDLKEGKLRHVLRGDQRDLFGGHLVSGEKEVATVGERGAITVFDIATGKSRLETRPLKHHVRVSAVSKDGHMLAIGYGDVYTDDMEPKRIATGSVHVFDLRSGREIAKRSQRGRLTSLNFALDDRLLLAGFERGHDGFAMDLAAKSVTFSLPAVQALHSWTQVVSPDGRLMARNFGDATFEIWDLVARKRIASDLEHAPGASISKLVFDEGSARVASLSTDGLVRVWPVADPSRSGNFKVAGGFARSVRFMDHKDYVAVGLGKMVKIVHVATGKTRDVLSIAGDVPTPPYSAATAELQSFEIGGGGAKVVARFSGHPVRVFMPRAGGQTVRLDGRYHDSREFIGFSRDGALIIERTADRFQLRDGKSLDLRRVVRNTHFYNLKPNQQKDPINGNLDGPPGANGRLALQGNGNVAIFRIPGLEIERQFPFPRRSINGAKLSNDGEQLMVASLPIGRSRTSCQVQEITIQSLTTAKRTTICGPYFHHTTPEFSADGTQLAGIGLDGSAWLIDAKGGQVKKLVPALRFASTVAPVFVGGDQKLLLARNHAIVVVGLGDGKVLATLDNHRSQITGFAASPDGERFASASMDQTVRIWDARTLEPLQTLPGANNISRAAFDADGRRIVVGSSLDIFVHTLTGDVAQLLARGKEAAIGCLSEKERKNLRLATAVPEWCIQKSKKPLNLVK